MEINIRDVEYVEQTLDLENTTECSDKYEEPRDVIIIKQTTKMEDTVRIESLVIQLEHAKKCCENRDEELTLYR